jgi:site-specific DNA recombinase
LKTLHFPAENIDWVYAVLKEKHSFESEYQEQILTKLKQDHEKLQNKIDRLYDDHLDQKIDEEFFLKKFSELRNESFRLHAQIESYQYVGRKSIDEGIKLLDLAHRAADLFERQEPKEKRRLLDFVVSNCEWKERKLAAKLRQPFDLIADMAALPALETPVSGASQAESSLWRGRRDSNPRPPT